MNNCIRKNLYAFLGDIISIVSGSDFPDCTRVAVLPFQNTTEGL
jgi:hypothetical protein